MSSSLENKLCDAIDIMVNRAVNQASYDRTVQATIVKCIDQTIGKYKIKYQDSFYYAYSNNSDVVYSDGSSVYIQIPENDLNKQKTILGSVKKLGINYITTIEEDEAYEVVGKNCIESNGSWSLCSYTRQPGILLYDRDNHINDIHLNTIDAEEYLKTSGAIICGMKVKTSLPVEHQLRGNYGVSFAIDFLDNSNGETVTRIYTVDVNKMYGNPYRLTKATRQYSVFEIDGANFISIKYINIFNYDFPLEGSAENKQPDIFFSDFELSGGNRLDNEDINNYSLTFVTPRGKYFDKDGYDTLTIKAEVRVKGKIVDPNSQELFFYWFIEHAGITSKSSYYNKYGGQGWKCLNESITILDATDTDSEVVQWLPGKDSWTVEREDVIAKTVKYKCVVVYDGTVISREIDIINRNAIYDVTIESDKGTTFYFDGARQDGFPTLTCLINGKENTNITYSWSITTSSGNFQSLAETARKNEQYNDNLKEYNNIKNALNKGETYIELVKERLEELESFFENDKTDMRVEKNKIYHADIRQITNFSTYSCTVYNGNTYIGTASIVLNNKLYPEGSYSLVINNGTHIYKYNESGISPASHALDNPIDIEALTFTIYDSDGNAIDREVASHSDIKWSVPALNTLLKISSNYGEPEIDVLNNRHIYKNMTSFSYFIEDRYDITKQDNNISLFVIYKGISLSASTDLTFVKEGDSGTNGTEFSCRIVPNISDETSFGGYPMLIQYGSNVGNYDFNFSPRNFNTPFRIQLWHNENRIFENVISGTSEEGKAVSVKWSVLKNCRSFNDSDISTISMEESTGTFSFSGFSDNVIANIIQAEIVYDEITYYTTLPLITSRVVDRTYNVELKYGTGFRYAIYSSDGRTPKYDNSNPFEIETFKSQNGTFVNASNEYTYSFNINGSNSLLIRPLFNQVLKNNQYSIKPIDAYDGESVVEAVKCVISKNNQEIARIHIPVHLYLNRYGLSAINGWDGNNVDISTEGGYILAPQIGAGQKERDNSFTGVVMGKVKESGQTSEDVGLLGYSSGERSIFLDAKTGKAEFGIKNSNRIIIDPSSGAAEIRSGNYSTTSKTGMLIDFSTPQILFGSGRFSVNEAGEITAKGGGTIAGWHITDTKLYQDKVGISSVIGDSNYAFWAGATVVKDGDQPQNPLFGVRYDGTILAQQGEIGRGTSRIIIGRSAGNTQYSAIYTSSKNKFDADSAGFYIGTDGIALGRYRDEVSNFQVDSNGTLTARAGYIGNGEQGWTIGDTFIKNNREDYNKASIDSSGGVYIGVAGIGLGVNANDFRVSKNGTLTCQKGTIGGWTISAKELKSTGITLGVSNHDGEIRSSNWYIRGDGTASFANVTITGGSLNINNRAIINSDGSASFSNITITGGSLSINGKASIDSQGNATFSNVSITGGSISIGGTSINGNELKMTASSTKVGNVLLDSHIEDIAINNLSVGGTFIFKENAAEWMTAIIELKNFKINTDSDGKIKSASIQVRTKPFLTALGMAATDGSTTSATIGT